MIQSFNFYFNLIIRRSYQRPNNFYSQMIWHCFNHFHLICLLLCDVNYIANFEININILKYLILHADSCKMVCVSLFKSRKDTNHKDITAFIKISSKIFGFFSLFSNLFAFNLINKNKRKLEHLLTLTTVCRSIVLLKISSIRICFVLTMDQLKIQMKNMILLYLKQFICSFLL